MIIYRVTCLATNKIYIGKTVSSLENRKREHVYAARDKRYNSAFHAAIRKYGMENFVWEIVEKVLFAESLIAIERHYIKLYDCMAPNGYNLTAGGDGRVAGYPSLETKAKISAAHKGKKLTLEHRAKMSEAHKNQRRGFHGRYASA
jgi:group I intron endonuclease